MLVKIRTVILYRKKSHTLLQHLKNIGVEDIDEFNELRAHNSFVFVFLLEMAAKGVQHYADRKKTACHRLLLVSQLE